MWVTQPANKHHYNKAYRHQIWYIAQHLPRILGNHIKIFAFTNITLANSIAGIGCLCRFAVSACGVHIITMMYSRELLLLVYTSYARGADKVDD